MSETKPKKETIIEKIEEMYQGAREDPSVAKIAANPLAAEPAKPSEASPSPKSDSQKSKSSA